AVAGLADDARAVGRAAVARAPAIAEAHDLAVGIDAAPGLGSDVDAREGLRRQAGKRCAPEALRTAFSIEPTHLQALGAPRPQRGRYGLGRPGVAGLPVGPGPGGRQAVGQAGIGSKRRAVVEAREGPVGLAAPVAL